MLGILALSPLPWQKRKIEYQNCGKLDGEYFLMRQFFVISTSDSRIIAERAKVWLVSILRSVAIAAVLEIFYE